MQSAVAKKFNILPGISIPLSLFNVGFPLGTTILGGVFYTFSGKTQEDGTTSSCTRRRKSLVQEIGRSISTIRRGFIALKDGFISAVEDKENTYIFDHNQTPEERFVRIPYKLLNNVFTIKYKERNNRPARTEVRQLTQAEASVGGLIITFCDDIKKTNKNKKFETSNAEIAEALGLSEPTVQEAIDALVGAHIIYRKRAGVNRYQKSIYGVHREYLRIAKKQLSEAKKSAPQSAAPQEIIYKSAEEWRREKIAEEERAKALEKRLVEGRQEYFYNLAMKDEQFREAEKELDKIVPDLVFAEMYNSSTFPELKVKYEKYKRQRIEALKRLQITEKDIGRYLDDKEQAN